MSNKKLLINNLKSNNSKDMSNKQIEEMSAYLSQFTPILSENNCHYVAERAYKDGYRKQEWISVDERLPEECKNVLCFEGKKIVIAFMEKTEDCGEYVPVFWDWIAYDRDDTYDEVCVTHWMPLPEAPKMKGGAE